MAKGKPGAIWSVNILVRTFISFPCVCFLTAALTNLGDSWPGTHPARGAAGDGAFPFTS